MAHNDGTPVDTSSSPPVGESLPEAADEINPDVSVVRQSRWFTPRNVVVFTILWVAGFSVGSLFISNPFQSETSAGANPNYWHVMYLHGLLIALVGLIALTTCQVLRLRSMHTRIFVVLGVIVATVAASIGGIFDKRIPGAEVAMWTQIVGFFALDEILLVLLIGMAVEWRRRSALTRSLAYATAMAATASMFAAAVMGHLAGWLLEFGGHPAVLASYARAVGLKVSDWTGSLIGSHSHDMVVAVMAMTVSLAVVQFGGLSLTGRARALVRLGIGLVGFGVVFMTVLYLVMGFTTWGPPTLFQSAGGTNGVAGDDIVTGVFVMGGGLLALASVAFARRGMLRAHALRLASAWAWLASFAMAVVAGFAIELHETYFGAGSAAPGAAKDAVYTWLHQDIGLFLLPAIALTMVVVERLVARRYHALIAWSAIGGTSFALLGGLIFVFVDPALHGAGFVVSMVGLVLVGVALLLVLWATTRSASMLASERVPVSVEEDRSKKTARAMA
jgi:hypothetical protein